MSGKDAIRLFKQYGVMDYLGSFYDVLHTVGDAYIVHDIDLFIAARQPEALPQTAPAPAPPAR